MTVSVHKSRENYVFPLPSFEDIEAPEKFEFFQELYDGHTPLDFPTCQRNDIIQYKSTIRRLCNFISYSDVKKFLRIPVCRSFLWG